MYTTESSQESAPRNKAKESLDLPPLPKMKTVFGIRNSNKFYRTIEVNCDERALGILTMFGHIRSKVREENLYFLDVDARYDFQEVLDFMTKFTPQHMALVMVSKLVI